MNISDAGLKFIMKWEGTVLHPYKDVAGIATIGCGHVIKHGESFGTITLEKAMELLRHDVSIAENAVNSSVKVPLTQNAYDALCSFTFNLGTGSLKKSTLLKLLNAGNYAGAAQQFLYWNKVGSNVNEGISNRRKSESKLFTTPDAPSEGTQNVET
jgi:lysozyme